jgi:hypothetical protein
VVAGAAGLTSLVALGTRVTAPDPFALVRSTSTVTSLAAPGELVQSTTVKLLAGNEPCGQ